MSRKIPKIKGGKRKHTPNKQNKEKKNKRNNEPNNEQEKKKKGGFLSNLFGSLFGDSSFSPSKNNSSEENDNSKEDDIQGKSFEEIFMKFLRKISFKMDSINSLFSSFKITKERELKDEKVRYAFLLTKLDSISKENKENPLGINPSLERNNDNKDKNSKNKKGNSKNGNKFKRFGKAALGVGLGAGVIAGGMALLGSSEVQASELPKDDLEEPKPESNPDIKPVKKQESKEEISKEQPKQESKESNSDIKPVEKQEQPEKIISFSIVQEQNAIDNNELSDELKKEIALFHKNSKDLSLDSQLLQKKSSSNITPTTKKESNIPSSNPSNIIVNNYPSSINLNNKLDTSQEIFAMKKNIDELYSYMNRYNISIKKIDEIDKELQNVISKLKQNTQYNINPKILENKKLEPIISSYTNLKLKEETFKRKYQSVPVDEKSLKQYNKDKDELKKINDNFLKQYNGLDKKSKNELYLNGIHIIDNDSETLKSYIENFLSNSDEKLALEDDIQKELEREVKNKSLVNEEDIQKLKETITTNITKNHLKTFIEKEIKNKHNSKIKIETGKIEDKSKTSFLINDSSQNNIKKEIKIDTLVINNFPQASGGALGGVPSGGLSNYGGGFSQSPQGQPNTQYPSYGGSGVTTPSGDLNQGLDFNRAGADVPIERVKQYSSIILEASEKTGIPAAWLATLINQESAFNANTKTGTTSATGLGQVLATHWEEMKRTYGKQVGIDQNASIHDQRANVLITAAQMARGLKNPDGSKKGIMDVYLSHFFGPGGGPAFMRKFRENPNQLAATNDYVVGNKGMTWMKMARANPTIFFADGKNMTKSRTVGEVYNYILKLLSKKVVTLDMLQQGNNANRGVPTPFPTPSQSPATPQNQQSQPNIQQSKPEEKPNPESKPENNIKPNKEKQETFNGLAPDLEKNLSSFFEQKEKQKSNQQDSNQDKSPKKYSLNEELKQQFGDKLPIIYQQMGITQEEAEKNPKILEEKFKEYKEKYLAYKEKKNNQQPNTLQPNTQKPSQSPLQNDQKPVNQEPGNNNQYPNPSILTQNSAFGNNAASTSPMILNNSPVQNANSTNESEDMDIPISMTDPMGAVIICGGSFG